MYTNITVYITKMRYSYKSIFTIHYKNK